MRANALVEQLGSDARAVRLVDALARHPRRALFDFGGFVEVSRSQDGASQRCHVGYTLAGALDVAGRIAPKRRHVDALRLMLHPYPAGLTGLVGVVRDGDRPRIKLYLARGEACSPEALQAISRQIADLYGLPPLDFPVGRTDVLGVEYGFDGSLALKAYQTFSELEAALALVPPAHHDTVREVWAQRPEDPGRCAVMVVLKPSGTTAIQLRVSPSFEREGVPRCPPGTLPTYVSLDFGTGRFTSYHLLNGDPLRVEGPEADSPEVAPPEEPKAIDVSIGETCNNNCTFCINPTESWAPLAPDDALRTVISSCAEQGYVRLSFLGGEPTLHPQLPELVEHSLASGFEEVMLITNGRRLGEPGYAQRLYDAGVRRALFMLLSHKARVHDQITRRKGSLREALKGALRAQAAGIVVGANIPITRTNVDHLTETAGALTTYGIKNFAFLYLSAYGNVLTSPGVMAPLEQTAAELRRAIERLKDMDVTVHVDNFPFCYLPGYEEYIVGEMANPWREIAYPSGAIVDVSDVFRFRKKRLPQCDGCRWDTVCGGIQDVDRLDEIAVALKEGRARARALS